MPIAIDRPFAWTSGVTDNSEEGRFLRSLQGNILKGHGRDFTANLFFAFPDDPAAGRAFLAELLGLDLVTDALKQLKAAAERKESEARGDEGALDGGTFGHIALSRNGYRALARDASAPTGDAFFEGGMKAASSTGPLGDTPEAWSEPFRATIDGLVLIGDDHLTRLNTMEAQVAALMARHGLTLVRDQRGQVLRDAEHRGIEHFGYVDGRSQPLLLEEDIDKERFEGIFTWDPAAPLGSTLVKDPATSDTFSYGSYFIFRKLEQDVAGLKLREQELADQLQLPKHRRELAGAMIVGRFEDGTPVTEAGVPAGGSPPNNFTYASDSAGARCPFHSHIRKTNPRGAGGFGSPASERDHLMVRRGIPFEDVERRVKPKDLPEAETIDEFREKVLPLLPTGGVGLLFMAYNANIGRQFVFTQATWADNTGFPAGGPHGIDPVIGTGPNGPNDQKLPKAYDEPAKGFDDDVAFQGFVTMRGGEYFFSPSIEGLRRLSGASAAMAFAG